MPAHQIMVTAEYQNETHTLNYIDWSALTGANMDTIRKRVSKRNQQIKDGKQPYSFEEVVGAVQLTAHLPAKRKPNTKIEELFNNFHRKRLVP